METADPYLERPNGNPPLLEELGMILRQATSEVIDTPSAYGLIHDILHCHPPCTEHARLLIAALGFWRVLFDARAEFPASVADTSADSSRGAPYTDPIYRDARAAAEGCSEHIVGEIIKNWDTRNIPLLLQDRGVSLLLQGFDETWTNEVIQAAIGNTARLDAWFKHSRDMDLRPWLTPALKTGVALILRGEPPFARPELVPAMIQSGLNIKQLTNLLAPDISPERLEVTFGPTSAAPLLLKYGLLRFQTLREWLMISDEHDGPLHSGRHEGLELMFECAPASLSPLRQTAGDLRECLLRLVRAADRLGATMQDDSELADRCAALATNWRAASIALKTLLHPALEADAAMNPIKARRQLMDFPHDYKSPELRRYEKAVPATALRA